MIENNAVLAIMYTSLPPQYVIQPSKKTFYWKLSYMKLKHQVYTYTHEHEEKAKALFKKKSQRRSKKTIMHGKEWNYNYNDTDFNKAIRNMMMGIQIATKNTVYNHKEGNDLYFEMLGQPDFQDYATFEAYL
jgi:hypothetical protein